MANEISWESAKAKGYKTDVASMTRNTIADGNLLNSEIIEPLSSRDQYIMNESDDLENKYESVKKTIQDNKDTNWPNSLVTGFSAININNDSIVAESRNTDLTIASRSPFLTASIENDAINFKMPSIFTDAYRLNTTNTIPPWPKRMYTTSLPTGETSYTTNNLDVCKSTAINQLSRGCKYNANIIPHYYYVRTVPRRT